MRSIAGIELITVMHDSVEIINENKLKSGQYEMNQHTYGSRDKSNSLNACLY